MTYMIQYTLHGVTYSMKYTEAKEALYSFYDISDGIPAAKEVGIFEGLDVYELETRVMV